ncbi:MAG TPA: hypothetical protein VH020_01095 [Stellaceae bacterium]|nr:hypothetical protein [Stellaceae bacterium]
MKRGMVAALLCLVAASAGAHEVDLTHLPLGDGKIAHEPKRGWIWACRIDPGAGGAWRDGPWIKPDGTYDFTKKAIVPGDVKWPSHYVMTLAAGRRRFTTNDFPDHGTGIFPIPPDSEAFQYDRNPNRIALHTIAIPIASPCTPSPSTYRPIRSGRSSPPACRGRSGFW